MGEGETRTRLILRFNTFPRERCIAQNWFSVQARITIENNWKTKEHVWTAGAFGNRFSLLTRGSVFYLNDQIFEKLGKASWSCHLGPKLSAIFCCPAWQKCTARPSFAVLRGKSALCVQAGQDTIVFFMMMLLMMNNAMGKRRVKWHPQRIIMGCSI